MGAIDICGRWEGVADPGTIRTARGNPHMSGISGWYFLISCARTRLLKVRAVEGRKGGCRDAWTVTALDRERLMFRVGSQSSRVAAFKFAVHRQSTQRREAPHPKTSKLSLPHTCPPSRDV